MDFETLWMRHQRYIQYYISVACHQASDKEDILQETAIRALRSFHRLKDPECFPAWIRRIAYCAVIDYYRSHKQTVPTEDSGLERICNDRRNLDDPYDAVVRRLSLEELLSDRWGKALILHHYYGISIVEISRLMGLKYQTTARKIREKKMMVRQAMQEEGSSDEAKL